jgi:2'-5' RNA ligase
MLKTITKCFAIIFLFSASNESFSTNLYTKMLPSTQSLETLEYHLKPILEEANAQLNGKLIYNSSNWHMTLKALKAPDHLREIEIRDWSTSNAEKFNLKYLYPKVESITNLMSTIDFKINGVTLFGKDESQNKFIVLTLEPVLSHIKDKATRTKIRHSILEKRPHISLGRFKHKIGSARHNMFTILNRANDIIENNDINIKFNKTSVEIANTLIHTYSASQPIELAAY